MKIQLDSNTVLPSPLDRLEEVSIFVHIAFTSTNMILVDESIDRDLLPSNALCKRLAITSFDSPVREGNTDPVEASCSDLSEILFRLWFTQHDKKTKRRERNKPISRWLHALNAWTYDECIVVILEDLGDAATVGISIDRLGQRPFVDGSVILFEICL